MPRRLIKRIATEPMLVRITVFKDWIHSLSEVSAIPSYKSLMTIEITRLFMAHGVQRIEIKENGLRGTLFLPSTHGRYPGEEFYT